MRDSKSRAAGTLTFTKVAWSRFTRADGLLPDGTETWLVTTWTRLVGA